MTVSNTPLNHVTAHKQYSEMADVPTAGNARVVDAYPTRLAQAPHTAPPGWRRKRACATGTAE